MQYYRKLKWIAVAGILLVNAGVAFAVTHPLLPVVKPGYHVNKNYDLVPNDKTTNAKVVLITIDDGPTKRAPEMMKILTKHNAKAIFFVNGIHSKDVPEMLADETKAGFTIGNHTWDHMNLKLQKNQEKIKKEVDDNTKLIIEKTGSNPKFFRPPYGASSAYVRDLVKKDGMIFMNWSGAAKDWEKNTKDEKVFLKNVMTDLHSGEIILIHEHPWTVSALDDLLTQIEARGYTFADPSQITE